MISLIKDRFNCNTLTFSSPKIPSNLFSVLSFINFFNTSLEICVFFDTLSIWTLAASTEICGSNPDPDAVIISAGISSLFIVGFSCRNFLISSLILFSNLGLLDAKFSLPDDGKTCPFVWKYYNLQQKVYNETISHP